MNKLFFGGSRVVTGFVAGLSALVMSGCATQGMKDELNSTKRVAVISVYGNAVVPESKSRGVVKGSGWGDSLQMEIAEGALRIFEKELARLGYEVVSANEVIASAEYKTHFGGADPSVATSNKTVNRMLSAVSDLAESQARGKMFAAPGMYPIYIHSDEQNKYSFGEAAKTNPKAVLAQFAKKLNVDAVVVAHIDYCYQAGTWSLGGTGEAEITAGTTIKMVNQNEKIIADLGEVPRCAGKTRANSDNTMGMIQGDLMLLFTKDRKIQNMFAQATSKSFAKSIDIIEKIRK